MDQAKLNMPSQILAFVFTLSGFTIRINPRKIVDEKIRIARMLFNIFNIQIIKFVFKVSTIWLQIIN